MRRIRYHDPESLPLEDYFFTYRATLDGLTEGGAPLMELMKSGVRGLARLAPNEASRFQFEAEAERSSALYWKRCLFRLRGDR